MAYIGSLDQGTSSTRFMIFDGEGKVVGQHQLEHRQILPQAGWVEHDAAEIWDRTKEVIAGALKQADILGSDFADVLAAALADFAVWESEFAAITGRALAAPNEIRQTRVTSQKRFKYIPNCLPKLLTYRMINNFYFSAAVFSNRGNKHTAICSATRKLILQS